MKSTLLLPVAIATSFLFTPSLVLADTLTNNISDNDINNNKTDSLYLGTVERTKPIKRIPPKYPKSALTQGKEGWVSLSYVVAQDGTVSNVIVQDSSNEIFEKSAVDSLQQWQYSPAMKDGKAIQRCENQVVLSFRLSKEPKGASRVFVKNYRIANQYLEKGNIEKAKAMRDEIEERGRWNSYEDMFFQMLNTQIAQQEANENAEFQAIEAVLRHRKLLKQDQIAAYVSRLFVLSLKTQQFGKIKRHFEELLKTQSEHPQTKVLQPYYDKVVAIINSETPIQIKGEISKRDYWYYRLNRHNFGITQVNGKLNKLEVRCDNKLSEFLIEENSVWHVPEHWGQCDVFVFGKQNASFTLTELYDSI